MAAVRITSLRSVRRAGSLRNCLTLRQSANGVSEAPFKSTSTDEADHWAVSPDGGCEQEQHVSQHERCASKCRNHWPASFGQRKRLALVCSDRLVVVVVFVAVAGGEVVGRLEAGDYGTDRFVGEGLRLLGEHVGDLCFEVLEHLEPIGPRRTGGGHRAFDRIEIHVDRIAS